MGPEHVKAISLEMLIIVVGIVGLLVLIGLAICWQRYLQRQNNQDSEKNKKAKDNEYYSIWEQAGKRLQVDKEDETEFEDDIDFKRRDIFDDDDS